MTVTMTGLFAFRLGLLGFRLFDLRMMLCLLRLFLPLLLCHRIANGIKMLLLRRVKLSITGADSFAEFPQFRLSGLDRFGHTLELYSSANSLASSKQRMVAIRAASLERKSNGWRISSNVIPTT